MTMLMHHMLRAAAGAGAAPPVATDPQFNYVSLLLNDTGTNGQQNNTFLDSSSNNFTITRNGTPTQGSVTPYWPDGQWSNYFSGTTQAFAAQPNSAFLFGTGDFTIELWAYIAGNSALDGGNARRATVFAVGSSINSGITFTIEGNSTTTGTGLSLFRNINTQTGIAVTGTVPQNAWNHIAVCRSGTSLRFFLNGTQMGSTITDSGIWGSSTYTPFVGGNPNNGSYTQYTNGYISNFRVVKGTALYTSNFTPSTTPLTAVSGTSLLTCQSNRFKDNSSNNFAITVTGTPTVQAFEPFEPASSYATSVGGSGYFNGSTDYISAPSGTAFNFGSGEFTAECWCYLTSRSSIVRLFAQTSLTVSNVNILFDVGTNGVATAYVATGSGYVSATGAGVVALNAWTHVAMTRDVNTLRLYVNGVQSGSASLTGITVPSCTSPFIVGRNGDYSSNYVPGYISDMRVIKGSCVYPSGTTFTPPTSPVTAITGTSLLLNCTDAGIYDAATLNDLVTVGNAQVSTAQAKFGSSSMAFDGTGDSLFAVYSPMTDIGGKPFTVQCWLNTTNISFATYQSVFSKRIQSGTSNAGLTFGIKSNGSAIAWNGSTEVGTSGVTLASNTWYHVAWVYNGTALQIYVNGTQRYSATYSIAANSYPVQVGCASGSGVATDFFNGYIDDLRVTTGYARYTANFTPPTAPFPTR